VFAPLHDLLLLFGDHYMHLADLTPYCRHTNSSAHCMPICAWARNGILNVASSGSFRAIDYSPEYASDIWKVQPCPVP